MKRFTFKIVFTFIIIVISACEKIETLDLPETDNRLVVESIISTEDLSYTVKLTRTQKYSFTYDTASIKHEKGAKVVISDNTGIVDTLKEISTGIFQTHKGIIKGEVGRNYNIDIISSDGKHYKSDPEKMLAAPKIDSIYFDRDYSDKYKYNQNAYRYNVYIDWHDPKDEKNYYMFVISYFWNGIWQQQYQWNWIMNDYQTDGHFYKKVKVVSDYGQKYFSVKINLYALQKNNYDYWRILYDQKWTSFDGYVNNTVPLIGNIYNTNDPNDYAIGYFQVSGTSVAMIYIGR